MSAPISPYESAPPSARRIVISLIVAVIAAAAILVAIVLPAEYGIDPTRIGGLLGLTELNQSSGRTVQVVDVIGGNERVREVTVPESGKPTPLPNPAIHQLESGPARTETLQVSIPPFKETEVKTVLQTNKVVLYSWKVDRGQVYVDYHGHDPAAANKEFFVRYQESDASTGAEGSLVAPFAGEHGWFWQNYNDHPVVITLTVTGYYDKVVNYGIF